MEYEVQSWLERNNIPKCLINYVVYEKKIKSMQQLVKLDEKTLCIDLDVFDITKIEKSKFKRICKDKREELQKEKDAISKSLQSAREISSSEQNDFPLHKAEEVAECKTLQEQYDLEVEFIRFINQCMNGETTKLIDGKWVECRDEKMYRRVIKRLFLSKENHQERAQRLLTLMSNTDRQIAPPIKMATIKKRNLSKLVKKVTINEKANKILNEVEVPKKMDHDLESKRQEAFLRNEELEKEKEKDLNDSSIWICPQCKGKNSNVYYSLYDRERGVKWKFLQCHVCSSRYNQSCSYHTCNGWTGWVQSTSGIFLDTNSRKPSPQKRASSPATSHLGVDKRGPSPVPTTNCAKEEVEVKNPPRNSEVRRESPNRGFKIPGTNHQSGLHEPPSKVLRTDVLDPSESKSTNDTTVVHNNNQKVCRLPLSDGMIKSAAETLDVKTSFSSVNPSYQKPKLIITETANESSSVNKAEPIENTASVKSTNVEPVKGRTSSPAYDTATKPSISMQYDKQTPKRSSYPQSLNDKEQSSVHTTMLHETDSKENTAEVSTHQRKTERHPESPNSRVHISAAKMPRHEQIRLNDASSEDFISDTYFSNGLNNALQMDPKVNYSPTSHETIQSPSQSTNDKTSFVSPISVNVHKEKYFMKEVVPVGITPIVIQPNTSISRSVHETQKCEPSKLASPIRKAMVDTSSLSNHPINQHSQDVKRSNVTNPFTASSTNSTTPSEPDSSFEKQSERNAINVDELIAQRRHRHEELMRHYDEVIARFADNTNSPALPIRGTGQGWSADVNSSHNNASQMTASPAPPMRSSSANKIPPRPPLELTVSSSQLEKYCLIPPTSTAPFCRENFSIDDYRLNNPSTFQSKTKYNPRQDDRSQVQSPLPNRSANEYSTVNQKSRGELSKFGQKAIKLTTREPSGKALSPLQVESPISSSTSKALNSVYGCVVATISTISKPITSALTSSSSTSTAQSNISRKSSDRVDTLKMFYRNTYRTGYDSTKVSQPPPNSTLAKRPKWRL